MIYCFDKILNFDYSKSEIALSHKAGNGILYDSDKRIFTDFNGNKVDITGKVLFPRTGVLQMHGMTEEIERQGGIPAITNAETEKISRWPKYFKTKRKTRILTGRDLQDPSQIEQIEKEYGKEIFIKTVQKGFNGVIPVSLLKDRECAFYKALSYHQDDEFMISEVITLAEDRYGIKEYRCFVRDNEPLNISRFTTRIFHEIDEEVLVKLKEVIERMKGIFPDCYVVDLLEYEKDGERHLDVSEFNPPQAAGLYLYNSLLEKSDDILHKRSLRKIATEFITEIDKCSENGTVINNREPLFDIEESFASDLRSICLLGDIGVTFVADLDIAPDCYASHTPLLMFEVADDDTFSTITEESCLSDNKDEKVYVKKEDN